MDYDTYIKVKREVRKKTASYIVAGLALVAGLAWNDAITSLIEHLFPRTNNTLFAKFVYAVVVTAIIVVAGLYITKLLAKEKQEEEEEKEKVLQKRENVEQSEGSE